MTPDALFDFVGQDIDSGLAIPDFHDACLRYLQNAKYELSRRVHSAQPKEIKKTVPVTFRDGSMVNYCVLKKEILCSAFFLIHSPCTIQK